MSTTHFKCCVLRNFCFAVSKCRYCLSRLKIWSEGNRNVHYSIKWFREFYRDIEYTKSYSIVATIQCLYETVAIRMSMRYEEHSWKTVSQYFPVNNDWYLPIYIFFWADFCLPSFFLCVLLFVCSHCKRLRIFIFFFCEDIYLFV